jgi:hypothetical protein
MATWRRPGEHLRRSGLVHAHPRPASTTWMARLALAGLLVAVGTAGCSPASRTQPLSPDEMSTLLRRATKTHS